MTGVVRLKPVIGEVTCVLGWGQGCSFRPAPVFSRQPVHRYENLG